MERSKKFFTSFASLSLFFRPLAFKQNYYLDRLNIYIFFLWGGGTNAQCDYLSHHGYGTHYVQV